MIVKVILLAMQEIMMHAQFIRHRQLHGLQFNRMSLRTDSDFCHQEWHTEIDKKLKIFETYRHDHSLESSGEALSDVTMSFAINPFQGKKIYFLNFSKKPQSLMRLNPLAPSLEFVGEIGYSRNYGQWHIIVRTWCIHGIQV
jgi:hypothetical protein